MELYKDPKAPVEKRVEDLLGLLTAAEKLEMLSGERQGKISFRPKGFSHGSGSKPSARTFQLPSCGKPGAS
jgi:hypothetical protein